MVNSTEQNTQCWSPGQQHFPWPQLCDYDAAAAAADESQFRILAIAGRWVAAAANRAVGPRHRAAAAVAAAVAAQPSGALHAVGMLMAVGLDRGLVVVAVVAEEGFLAAELRGSLHLRAASVIGGLASAAGTTAETVAGGERRALTSRSSSGHRWVYTLLWCWVYTAAAVGSNIPPI